MKVVFVYNYIFIFASVVTKLECMHRIYNYCSGVFEFIVVLKQVGLIMAIIVVKSIKSQETML